jgi:hypothetical protein
MTSPSSEKHQSNARRADELPVSRRGILKTGALTAGTVVIMEATGTAAARLDGNDGYRPPVPVTDSEDPDPDPAIVINGLDVPISDWVVFGSETVADQNPTCDPDDQVVIVVFEDLLDSGWPGWRQANPDTLFDGVVERGIKFHAFPKAHLKKGRPDRGKHSR